MEHDNLNNSELVAHVQAGCKCGGAQRAESGALDRHANDCPQAHTDSLNIGWYQVYRRAHQKIESGDGTKVATWECSCPMPKGRSPLGHPERRCPHLTALFAGLVREDPNETPKIGVPFVRLTPFGEEYFRWRWAEAALRNDWPLKNEICFTGSMFGNLPRKS